MATSSSDDRSDSFPHNFTIPPREQHTATVIFLHGLGDTGRDVSKALRTLTAHSELGHVKFVFPTAPLMPVTGMNRRVIPSWFDCYSFDIATRREDEKGLFQAVNWLNEYIAIEEREHGISANRIIIGGISQGGSVATLTTITTEKLIAGLFGLSTYIPLRHHTMKYAMPLSKKVPMFWGHGIEDLQIKHSVWKDLVEMFAGLMGIPFQHFVGDKLNKKDLQEEGATGLRFYLYMRLGHWVNDEELEDLATWISFLLPNVPA
ncbi:hypothetical protein NLJ89_g9767 [Agrocybe chaxingu]|uniref:Acyl-protein thioesterase 1 n=1 Tax=Agrocybe chaxingu TaxID=84603 RepID=A0A9W8JS26_9AGAR|nr:hypothetical protein NLJ89_g9767 [Agrocybe chaxingu]